MIPYGCHDIDQTDIDEVVKILKSSFLTQGDTVPEFETRVAEHCGAKHAVAVNSATSALHIACLSLGVSSGDRVWTSPISFVASSNAALYCGASVDFVDIDPNTYNLSADKLRDKLEQAKQTNSLPKVVIPVHLCGQSCEMAAIHQLSEEYGFHIIEDASHAIGGKYQGMPIGGGQYSDITIFSFHPVKIITTGEGGMALTNNPVLAEKMQLFRSHGITRDPGLMKHKPHGEWYYEQIDLGFNYRLTDIQAALGVSQLKRLDKFVSKRNELANRYTDLLSELPVITPFVLSDAYSSYHLYVIRIDHEHTTTTRESVFSTLRENGIGVNIHYIPIYKQPYYQGLGFSEGYCEIAEQYYKYAITLPLYPALTEQQQDQVVEMLKTALNI
ncbi:MAG: UDP-4-amino-4,6-dideoxy-N-acetyl-beta-L-altrosamine transaminase [Gammaproteobacteria bacterium]|nr:UDP-4-amino-4,6-dideoxy-N-acetyl-beta-L-altrosamine transaminase [Gammaproteobacteria bacterium]MDH5652074.1 UDP-4-amino-4,6-dideoxy-N-acetyl-beta-L-altrosamine transaminase [Gammaproteobacteria bacterium]